MKRKDNIALKALDLFNKDGVSNVSLRDIAKDMGISYGNITYHYPNKEALVMHLYLAMIEEHQAVSDGLPKSNDLLTSILKAPEYTFDISKKYLFLFADYAEIIRTYNEVAALSKELNTKRQNELLHLFHLLQKQDYLREDVDDEQLNYIMELSGVVRTFYFLNKTHDKKEYVKSVNMLLYPYLTWKGLNTYKKVMAILAEA